MESRRQKRIAEEGPGFPQVGGEDFLRRLAHRLEGADASAEFRQLAQGGFGAAAAVEQAIDWMKRPFTDGRTDATSCSECGAI